MTFVSMQDTHLGVRRNAQHVNQDFVDTIAVARPDEDDGYSISCPDNLKPRPLGLDMQGRHPEAAHAACEFTDDEARRIGWGAFLPAFLALSLVAACAAVVLLLKDFT